MNKFLANIIINHYKKILIITTFITLFSLYKSKDLEISTQFVDLLPQNDSYSVLYNKAIKKYNSLDPIIIGVYGERESIQLSQKKIIKTLKKIDEIISIEPNDNLDYINKNILLLMKKRYLQDNINYFNSKSYYQFFKSINDQFENSYIDDENNFKKNINYFSNQINSFHSFFKAISQNKIEKRDIDNLFFGDHQLISPDGKLGIIIIKHSIDSNDMLKINDFVNRLEKNLKILEQDNNIKISLTGTPVIIRDEIKTSTRDMNLSSILSLILILIIFKYAFNNLKYFFLASISLITGIIWTLAVTYYIYGKLNILTAMMGAILIGLGIDYNIYIITLYKELLKKKIDSRLAIKKIFRTNIRSIIMGSATTSISFIMFGISSFDGFSQFGVVLGIGIILTTVAAILILPSLLMIFIRSDKGIYMVSSHNIVNKINNYPKILILIFSILIIISIFNLHKIEFEKDMMKLEAKGLESVKLNRDIIKKFRLSSDISFFLSETKKENDELFKIIDNLKTVKEVDSLTNYLPPTKEQKEKIGMINKALKEKIDISGDLKKEIKRFKNNLIELSDLAYSMGETDLYKLLDRVYNDSSLNNLLNNNHILLKNEVDFFKHWRENYNLINTDKILDLTLVPNTIKNSYLSKDNQFLSIIFPTNDIWIEHFQNIHLKELNSTNKMITGTGQIFIRVIETEIKEGKKILFYSFIAIFLFILLDFKSLKFAILTLIPLVSTVIITLGIMAIFKLKFDAVNIMAIPLIIGLGIDDGIHVIHIYRLKKDIKSSINHTIKAISLTTITTISAFGSLLISKYRGFIGFGLILSIALLIAYLSTLFLLIPLIKIIDRR